MFINAKDEKGNLFIKKVQILDGYTGKVLSFGGFIEYNIEDLIEDYPFNRPLCIDVGGRNHLGIPNVCVSAEDMNKIFEELKVIFDENTPYSWDEFFKSEKKPQEGGD